MCMCYSLCTLDERPRDFEATGPTRSCMVGDSSTVCLVDGLEAQDFRIGSLEKTHGILTSAGGITTIRDHLFKEDSSRILSATTLL